jgi:putative transposase
MGALDSQRDEQQVPLLVSHRIWCPKRRSKVLVKQIGKRCEDLLRQQGDEQGWTMVERAVQPDHVPLVVRVWPAVSAADGVKECQGCSAFTLRKGFPARHRLPSLGTRSYFASPAGHVSRATIPRSSEAQSRQ